MGFAAIGTAIGIVAGVVTVISYFLPIQTTKARVFHAAYIFVITAAVGFGTYEATRYARLNDIARGAERLNNTSYNQNYGSEKYNEAAMTFLEKSKDIFPDAFKRASDDYRSVMKHPHTWQDELDLRNRLEGIVNQEGEMASQ